MRMPRRQVTTIELKRTPERRRSQWERACGKLWGMKKPFLRVTKWLGDIPVEAGCASCDAETRFRVTPTSHRPNREEYSNQLQRAFDQHCKVVHASEAHRAAEPPS